jgi:hypothetical protein
MKIGKNVLKTIFPALEITIPNQKLLTLLGLEPKNEK